jgi:signal transduction histidine kinase
MSGLARRLRPDSLRARLLLLTLGALVAAQVATFALFLDERGRAVVFATAQQLGGRTATLADALDAAPPEARPAMLAAARARGARYALDAAPLVDGPGWRPLDRLSRRIARAEDARGRAVRVGLADDWAGPEPGDGWDDVRGGRGALAISLALADGGWLNAVTRLGRPPLQWAWPALASIGLSALALTAAIWLAVGRIAAPMAALARAADRLGRGERPAPLPLRGPREARRLTGAFNAMAARLTRLLDERARTLAAIGHDLRSPITAMRLRIEMVDDSETRDRLTASVDEIQTLVEGALALSRGAGAEEPVETVDLRGLLQDLAAELAEAGGAVSLDAPEPLAAAARPMALKRALRNLAENAIRYGGAARIALRATPEGARVAIEDDGPGVPPEARERVFEPFVRLEASRSRDTGGAGLGLAIARAALEGMGGSVWLEGAETGGARAVAVLPLAGEG